MSNLNLLKGRKNSNKSVSNFIILGVLWSAVISNSWATNLEAEHKLEAIKQSLIDLAVKSNLQLGSSAYLDSQGVLHESSIISSDADVRCIRVLSYLQEGGIPSAEITADIFSAAQCPGTRPKIRRQAVLRVSADNLNLSHNDRVGDHYLSELLQVAESNFLSSLAGSNDWLVSSEIAYPSEYDHYVSGRSQDNASYRFDLTVRHNRLLKDRQTQFVSDSLDATYEMASWVAGQIPELDYTKPWPSQDLVYELTLVDRQTNSAIWSNKHVFRYPKVDRGYHKNTIPSSVKFDLKKINSSLVEQVTKAVDCRTDSYRLTVVPGRSDKFKISAGLSAGVAIGDQFLISADANILSQSLSLSGLSELGLAEVESVTRRTATLKYVAGPKPEGMGAISNSVALHF